MESIYEAVNKAIKKNEEKGITGVGLFFFNTEDSDVLGGEIIAVDEGINKWIPPEGTTLIYLGEESGENRYWIYYALIDKDKDARFVRVCELLGRSNRIEIISPDAIPVSFLARLGQEGEQEEQE